MTAITNKVRAIELRVDSIKDLMPTYDKRTQKALEAIKNHCREIMEATK